ncbi:MAG: aldehyde ferredoxin oxidoreductase C-terminal domain-containing protein [Pseudomonadota bacterium]
MPSKLSSLSVANWPPRMKPERYSALPGNRILDAGVHRLLPAIARREGRLGDLLADGSLLASKKIGKGMEYLTHSKGLEVPMHDPQGGAGHGFDLCREFSLGLLCGGSPVVCGVGREILSGDRV